VWSEVDSLLDWRGVDGFDQYRREHPLNDCWRDPIDDDGAIVQNSLDGRAFYERGERKTC
jgi:hypothetical protein